MYINTAEEVSGIPASWPRVDLTIGSTGEKCVRSRRNLHGFQDPIRRFRQLHRTESTDLPQERLSRSSSVSSVCRSPASLTTVPGIKFLKFMWQCRASRNWSKCKWGQSHLILCAASPIFFYAQIRGLFPFPDTFPHIFLFCFSYSTVTTFAKFLGLSTSNPLSEET